MVNQPKSARLYLRAGKAPRRAVWLIRDGNKVRSTGCFEDQVAEAEAALADYLQVSAAPDRKWLYGRLHLAKRRAAVRGREFTITVDDVIRLGEVQGWRCALTGLPFDFERGSAWSHPRAMAIDRRVNSRGYTPDNVRLVLHAINVAIGPWGEDEFAAIAAAFSAKRAPKKRQPVPISVCQPQN